jgi:protocatechuate 3,4-dioxygenase beta subunit
MLNQSFRRWLPILFIILGLLVIIMTLVSRFYLSPEPVTVELLPAPSPANRQRETNGQREEPEAPRDVFVPAGDADPLPSGKAEIAGTVLSEAGGALPGAELSLHEWLSPESRTFVHLFWPVRSRPGRRLATAMSDESGFYRFPGITSGNYMVTARLSGYAQTGIEVLHLGREEIRPAQVIRLAPGASIRGRVLNQERQPIDTARIHAFPLDLQTDQTGHSWLDYDPASTGEEGYFLLDYLKPGRYRLRVEAPGYAPGFLSEVSTGSDPVEVVLGRGMTLRGKVTDDFGAAISSAVIQIIQLNPQLPGIMESRRNLLPDPLKVNLFGKFAVAGVPASTPDLPCYVIAAAPGYQTASWPVPDDPDLSEAEALIEMPRGARLRGEVREASGGPLAGVEIEVLRARGEQGQPVGDFLSAHKRYLSSSAGRFLIPGLPRGTLDLRFSRRSYGVQYLEAIPSGTDELVVTLSRAGSILGRVLDADTGRGLGGIQISAWWQGSGENPLRMEPFTALSESSGAFAIEGLPPGRYSIWAVRGLVPASDTAEVSLQAGEVLTGLELVIGREQALAGRVLEQGSGRPIEGAVVTAIGPRGSRSDETNAAGWFEITPVRQGRWRLGASADGFARIFPGEEASLIFDLDQNESQRNILIRLSQGGRLRGRVVDSNNDPVAAAIVYVARAAEQEDDDSLPPLPSISMETGSEGVFVLEGVPGGRPVQVVADHLRYPVVRSDVLTVGNGETRDLGDMVLPQQGFILGRLLDKSGQPVQGRVFVADRASNTSASGFFKIGRIPAGLHTARVETGQGEISTFPVEALPKLPDKPVVYRLDALEGD